MTGKRSGAPGPWREWFFSLLLGVGLALVCVWLLGRAAPSGRIAPEETRDRNGVGLEIHFGFQILLPERKDG